MSGFGGALARGLAGYAQNRMIVDERDYRRKQDEAAALRQAEKDKEDAEFRRLQMAQVTEQLQRQRALDGVAAEGRMNAARADGLRPVDEARSVGGALGAGRGFASAGGAFGAVGESLASMGDAMQQRAQRPDATINGQSMVRMAESDQDRRDRIANQTRQGELMAAADAQRAQFEGLVAQLPAAIRPLATDLASAKALAAQVAEQRMAPAPREAAVNMQVIQTADGPMAFNPRTGRAEPITAGGQRVKGAAGNEMPKLTEAQRRVGGLVEIAEAERKNLEKLGTPSMWDRAMAKVPFGLGDPLMTPQGQQYMAASEAFARPYLYSVSGAAASDKEAAANARQAIPGPFAAKETQDEMTARRRRLVSGMRTIAGQPGDRVSRDESQAAAAFRANAKAEGYSDEEIDAELQRRGMR